MRNAVSEQIKALQDLSSIVQSSSQMFDHSSPRTAAAQPTPPTAPAAPAAGKPAEQPAAEAPRAVQPSRPAPPKSDLRGGLGVMQSGSQPAAGQPESRKPQSEGWVRDLLRSASRKEEEDTQPQRSTGNASNSRERNPRQVVESLNSLSVDIARAIDHDASVDLWRRYQSGERDIFTRRLYTLKGQKTFEEIKTKYAQEPEFRSAVDHYIADFEKLLADVARNDRDKVVTQTYLTSDTGKVYTMLAHASGRLK